MQQKIDADWHAGKTADQEDNEALPVDRAPERGDAEHLDRDAAQDHDAHHADRIVHQVEQQGAAQRRERKSRDAGNGRSREHRHQGVDDALHALRRQHRAFGNQKPEAEGGDNDHAEQTGIRRLGDGEFSALNEFF